MTAKDISILLYVTGEGGYNDIGSRGQIQRPNNQCFDANAQPQSSDDYFVDAGRIWEQYFNKRYQMYGRLAHIHICFATQDPSGVDTPSERAQDAAANYAAYKPFGVIVEDDVGGLAGPYIDTMAAKGVLTFGTVEERPDREFSSFPNLIWSFMPSLEEHARQFSTYVCTKVVPHTVSFGQVDFGQQRKLGLLYVDTPEYPGYKEFAMLVKQQVAACGGDFVDQESVPDAVNNDQGVSQTDPSYGPRAAAGFQSKGVTTVIWTEGLNDGVTPAASSIGYYPEWVIAGDGNIEDIVNAKDQDPREWAQAWVVTNQILEGPFANSECVHAAEEADPQLPSTDRAIPCRVYAFFRQLFTGIQIAGPHLTARNVASGFHAIPGNQSSRPDLQACFYPSGDYTCVKDAIPMWYDAKQTSPYSGTPGCWRVPEGGRRYLAGQWPSGDVTAQRNAGSDACNAYSADRYLDPSPGPDSPTPQ